MTPALLALVLAAEPRFVAPISGGWTTQATTRVYVAGQRDGGLRVGDVRAPCMDVAIDGGVLAHCTVALEQGHNTLTFTDSQGTTFATITRADTLSAQQPGVEPGFGPGTVHRPEVETLCAQCHSMSLDGGVADAGLPNTDGACVTCHRALTQRKRPHGPVGQGACLICHDPAAQLAVRTPVMDTCFTCHADLKLMMDKAAFRHGPAAQGRCTTCHDPHGSDEVFWLKKKPFDLCTNCHTEKRTERHVVVGFVYGDSHPLQGRPHPLKRNAEFACPACHNPHAAQARFLWQFDATERETLCRTCHAK